MRYSARIVKEKKLLKLNETDAGVARDNWWMNLTCSFLMLGWDKEVTNVA
jgi:hypothetical protein